MKDICHGLELLQTQKEALTFLGSIILINDKEHNAVFPYNRDQLPTKVLLIIDGQQRLTTLLLLITILHNEIGIQKPRISQDENKNKTARWLTDKASEILNQLERCFLIDMNYGQEEFRYYPKIIRAYTDFWSREPSEKKYDSSFSRYLYKYIFDVKQKESRKKFVYNLKTLSSEMKKSHLIFENNFKSLRRFIGYLSKGGHSDHLDFDILSFFIRSTQMQNSLFQNTINPIILDNLKNNNYAKLMRLLIFSKYVLERVVVAEIQAENESYAFDMFESLNTNGMLLTAFETFKPQIIRSEGLQEYKNSESRKSVTEIESFLEDQTILNSKKKSSITNEVLTSFALSETGNKLSNRLSEQRNELRKFEKLENLEEKQDMLRHLAYTSTYTQNFIYKNAKERYFTNPELNLDSETQICLSVLHKANHRITIAILARFYSKYRESLNNDFSKETKEEILKEVGDAIKAITAFFVLWRSSRMGTAGIDNSYRNIMKKGLGRKISNPKTISLKNLQILLVEELSGYKGQIKSKDKWLNNFIETPIFKTSQPLTRFILFLLMHNTMPDSLIPGLIKSSKNKTRPFFLFGKWIDSYNLEHIAPRNFNSGWKEELFNSENIRNTAGNLILLPPNVQLLENLSWVKTRHFYRLLSLSSLEEQKQIHNLTKINLKLSDIEYESLAKAKFSVHTDALARIEGEWNTEWVKKRSRRLGEILWERLMKWLPVEKLLIEIKNK